MSDAEARALAAADVITVDGTEYTLSPVKLQQLSELQRAAVKFYKQSYLETYRDNIDLIPKEKQELFLEKKLDEVAHWDIDDLPSKKSYSAERVQITDAIKKRLDALYSPEDGIPDEQYRNLLVAALDSAEISPKDVKELTGTFPRQGSISYDMWWVTGCFEGMINFIFESVKVKHPRTKKSDVSNWPMAKQIQAAQIVQQITTPDMGNT